MGAVAVHAPASLSGVDAELARLLSALDVEGLVEVGWDPDRRVFAPSPEHPVFGFRECEVNGCVGVSVTATGLCNACRLRWRVHQQDLSREAFVKVQRPRVEGCRKREVLCRVCCVPGFERPAYGPTGLCIQCKHSYMASGVASVDEWIAGGQPRGGAWKAPRPPARPRGSLGWCGRCGRRAAHPQPVSCAACRHAWKLAGRPDWDAWRRAHPPRGDTNPRVLVLRDAPERLMLEFLIGLQDALRGERKFNAWSDLTRLVRRLSQMRVASVLDVDESPIRSSMAQLLFARCSGRSSRRCSIPRRSSRVMFGGSVCCVETAAANGLT